MLVFRPIHMALVVLVSSPGKVHQCELRVDGNLTHTKDARTPPCGRLLLLLLLVFFFGLQVYLESVTVA